VARVLARTHLRAYSCKYDILVLSDCFRPLTVHALWPEVHTFKAVLELLARAHSMRCINTDYY
jgi:hypothetical protein